MCRDDPAIDFDWGSGSPGTGIPNDNFSVRWTRTLNLSAGNYTFTMGSDAGARWYIDGNLVRSDWGPHGYQTRDDSGWVPAGTYTIVVEYRETNNTNSARALFEW
jgi:beta-glucosidase